MLALSFQNVQKKFDDFTALESVSFDVKKGEFLALLGPNGAGKTTLINCLSGITKRSGGLIQVFDDDPEIAPEITKMKLGVVEQELVFDPFFTPIETLRLRRGLFGMKANEAYLLWLLKKLSLSDKKDVRARFLSGGMKRRLMIAKALAHEPEILILDEPTAGVDIELRKNLWAFIAELRKEKGITILLTTHYLEEAEELADRVAIINQGKILIAEDKRKLLARHSRILEIERMDGKVDTIEIKPGEDIGTQIQSCKQVKDIRIREPKLEEVFLEITSDGNHEYTPMP